MRLSPEARVRLGFAALALLVALAGCSYQLPTVCGICGGEVQVAAEDHGANLTVTSSEVHVYLRDDGSATWVERIELDDAGSALLRENATLRERVLERAAGRRSAAPETPDSVSVEGGALVVTYDVQNLAERYPGGVLVVNHFHRQRSGSSFGYEVGTDRAVLHAPDGMAVTNQPPASQWNESAVVWQSSVAAHTYVAFGPTWSKTTRWLTWAAIGVEVARWAAVPVAIGSFVSVSILGFAAWILLDWFGKRDATDVRWPEFDLDDALGKRLAGVGSGLLWGTLVVVLTAPESFTALFWLFTGVAVLLFGLLGAVAKRRRAARWPVALALVGTGPLVMLWYVLDGGPGLSVSFAAIWSTVVSLTGAVLFVVSSLLSSR